MEIDDVIFTHWPTNYDIKGWFVRLLENGYQDKHIHATGWVSGVVYLKNSVPVTPNEGAIELGLHGYELPIKDPNYPRVMHQPKKGDLILFLLLFSIEQSH